MPALVTVHKLSLVCGSCAPSTTPAAGETSASPYWSETAGSASSAAGRSSRTSAATTAGQRTISSPSLTAEPGTSCRTSAPLTSPVIVPEAPGELRDAATPPLGDGETPSRYCGAITPTAASPGSVTPSRYCGPMGANTPHGERRTYTSGCRCRECCDANTTYQRLYRHGPPPSVRVTTPGGYVYDQTTLDVDG